MPSDVFFFSFPACPGQGLQRRGEKDSKRSILPCPPSECKALKFLPPSVALLWAFPQVDVVSFGPSVLGVFIVNGDWVLSDACSALR